MYIMLVISILFTVIGVSLAYFSLSIIGNDTAKYNTITTGDLALTYMDSDELSLNGAFPGDSIEKIIKVKYNGTTEVNYNLTWQELTNTITNNELVIEGTCKSFNSNNEEDGECSDIAKKAVEEGNIVSNVPIKSGYIHEYTVKITFIDTGKPQNYNKNKTFKGKLGLTESSAKVVYCKYDGELSQGSEYVNGQYTYRYKQESDLSNGWQNITLDGWGVTLTDKTSKDEVNSELCTYINDKPVVSMYGMFSDSEAKSIDISSFNTSNVVNMGCMFFSVLNISSISTNSFDTSNVVDMSYMFSSTQISSIDLNTFNTSNVTNMEGMFSFNSELIELDLSTFDTSNVTNMETLFSASEKLKTIYVSDKFVTTSVVDGTSLFDSCTALIGGAGTTQNENLVDKTYAKIDEGENNPGYFTSINKKSESYIITYDANGGENASDSQLKYYNKDVTLSSKTPTRSGYAFLGWGISNSSTSISYYAGNTYSDNKNITLYAIWAKTYTITYNANGGTGAPSSQTKVHGRNLSLTSVIPAKTGYAFGGWGISSTATTATYKSGDLYTTDSDITLYAIWKNTYTVTYNANGGSNAPSNQTKIEDESLLLTSSSPTRSDYSFKGWATSSSSTTIAYKSGDYYEENRNIILYAVWKKLYSVTFYLGTHQSTSNVGTSKIEETDGTLNRTFTITNSVRMPVCDNDAKITVTQNATQAFITVTNVTANTTCYLYYDFA